MSEIAKTWMTSRQAMKTLGVTRDFLDNLRANGLLPAYTVGRTLFFKHEDVDRIVKTCHVPHEGETTFIYWSEERNTDDERISLCRNVADNVWRLQRTDEGVKITVEKNRLTAEHD